jgi:hypothetical protein
MALCNAKSRDRYRLDDIGDVDRTTYLRNQAVAKQSGKNTEDAGRIVFEAQRRCDLNSGRIAALIISRLLFGEGMDVPYDAVDFREEHSPAKHAEDDSGNPFAFRTKSASHTCLKMPQEGTPVKRFDGEESL